MIEFSVSFKREIFKVSIEDGQTLGDLKEAFYLLTKVAPSMQKLFHKGIKFTSLDDSTKVETFSEAIRKDPKVTLIGTTEVDFKKIEEKNVQLEESFQAETGKALSRTCRNYKHHSYFS
jgi:hypothetical protein